MRTILIFGAQEAADAQLALRAMCWYSALYDLDRWLRGHVKYNADGLPDAELAGMEKARDRLYAIMSEQGISFEDMP